MSLNSPEPQGPLLKWERSASDDAAVQSIAKRIVEMAREYKMPFEIDPMQIYLDTLCCHLNGCPLSLWQLLMSDGNDFVQDVLGIGIHLDRRTGRLMGGWVPRFAVANQQPKQ